MDTPLPGISFIETHPWKWYVPADARCLVIGTHPPTKRNWSFDFFYPNKRNFFWKIIAELVGKAFVHDEGSPAVAERKQALAALGVGVTDMGFVIERKGDSSLDENIAVVEYMEIHTILELFPSIDTILLMSSSGKTSAKLWFQKYLLAQGIELRFQGKDKVTSYKLAPGRRVSVVILPSPSPRYANANRLAAMTQLYGRYMKPQ